MSDLACLNHLFSSDMASKENLCFQLSCGLSYFFIWVYFQIIFLLQSHELSSSIRNPSGTWLDHCLPLIASQHAPARSSHTFTFFLHPIPSHTDDFECCTGVTEAQSMAYQLWAAVSPVIRAVIYRCVLLTLSASTGLSAWLRLSGLSVVLVVVEIWREMWKI